MCVLFGVLNKTFFSEKLCEEINTGTYQPGRSIAFVVDKPVIREIFAADFSDRVVHSTLF